MREKLRWFGMMVFCMLPGWAFASDNMVEHLNLHATATIPGFFALGLFVLAYLLVMTEEFSHLRKSKSVVLAAGIIWAIVAYLCQKANMPTAAEVAVRQNLLEYAELFLFLLVAMTYVNALQERHLFEALRCWLVRKGFGFRGLFWITGWLAFFISPVADNLTTALLMCAVVLAVGGSNKKFVALSCINIVVAANAGGAFSPFGDITTLMVWQAGQVTFTEFFRIFVPSVVNFVVPALLMHFAIPNEKPFAGCDMIPMKKGALVIAGCFFATIATTVCFHHFLHLPPVIGMLTGFGYISFYGYYLKHFEHKQRRQTDAESFAVFDVFQKVARAEWDTLLFFYGVILCVGGLAAIGYLALISHQMYAVWGASLPAIHHATPANVAIGVLSAIIDNIPIMFSVLTMDPVMSHGQWLLVTLTAGVGGSLLSIGSAAGVALMGQARGRYTFFSHLKWTWAIALGYIASIACHIWMNHALFF